MNIVPTQSPHSERQYLHTMIAGALLPFAQATITALVIGIGAWIIAAMVFNVLDAHKPAISLFAVTWVGMFIRLQRHWLSLTSIEQMIQRDLNQDGVIGEAKPEEQKPPRRVRINIEQIRDGAYSSDMVQLPGTDEQLFTFASGLLNGMPLSEKTWTPETKLYSIQDFRDLKKEMFKHALIEYVSEADKRQGIQLTTKGKSFMQEITNKEI